MQTDMTQTSSEPTTEQVQNAIVNLDPRVTLRNLAFWLDLSIAQGRMFDALLKPDNDKEQALPSDDAAAGE